VRWEGLGAKWLLRKDFYKVTVETLPPGTRRPPKLKLGGGLAGKGKQTNFFSISPAAVSSSDNEPIADLGAEALPWQRPAVPMAISQQMSTSTNVTSVSKHTLLTNSTNASELSLGPQSARGSSVGSNRSQPPPPPSELYFQAGREYELLPAPAGDGQQLQSLRATAAEGSDEVGQLEEKAKVALLEVGADTYCGVRVFYKAKGLKGWMTPRTKDGTLLLRRLDPLTCAEGHGLQLTKARHGKCAQCLKRFRRGVPVMECETCRWYLCEACHPHEEKIGKDQNHAYRLPTLAPP